MTKLDMVAGLTGLLSSAGAAIFWLWASLIEVPDNIDTFIQALQRAGQINSWAAGCACVGAVCASYGFARSINLL